MPSLLVPLHKVFFCYLLLNLRCVCVWERGVLWDMCIHAFTCLSVEHQDYRATWYRSQVLQGFWGFKLKSSGFHSKCFIHRALSQSWRFILKYKALQVIALGPSYHNTTLTWRDECACVVTAKNSLPLSPVHFRARETVSLGTVDPICRVLNGVGIKLFINCLLLTGYKDYLHWL